MAYPFNESFDSGIPAGFGSAGGSGGVTATWNASTQAVDLVFTANQSFWKITSAPQASDFWFEMDLEILAATANPYFGFWLWSGVGNYEGHRLAVINGYWYHSFWNPSGSEAEQIAATPAAWAVTGARAVLRLDVRRSAAGLWQYRLTVNGSAVWQESKRWYSTLIPGVFGNATTLRLHRAAGNTPSALPDAPAIGARALHLPPARRILVPEHAAALRFNHRGLRRLAALRNHYYHGTYRITGTVKEKGPQIDVPVSRRVLLIDERANFVVRETWSDPATGAYAFLHINPEIQYLVISYDYQQNFRAAVADNLTAEPMP